MHSSFTKEHWVSVELLSSLYFIFYFPSESKHCPPSSDTRILVTNPGSDCHKKLVGRFFDVEDAGDDENQCSCCYNCTFSHANQGCSTCKDFLGTFLPLRTSKKLSKSVSSELKSAIEELFAAMSVKVLQVESDLVLGIASFVKDFLKNVDEVNDSEDIIRIWHINSDVAKKVFSIMYEVLHGEEDLSEASDSSSDESSDVFDEEESDSSSGDDAEQLEMLNIYDD